VAVRKTAGCEVIWTAFCFTDKPFDIGKILDLKARLDKEIVQLISYAFAGIVFGQNDTERKPNWNVALFPQLKLIRKLSLLVRNTQQATITRRKSALKKLSYNNL
jgi:hypothetical protein